MRKFLLCMLLALTASLIWGAELYSDTFTGQQNTKPANWKIPYPAINTWVLKNGQLYAGNGDILEEGYKNTMAIVSVKDALYWTDYQVEADAWTKQQNGAIELIARYQDRKNYYRLEYETYRQDIYLRILRVKGGKEKSLIQAKNGLNGVRIPNISSGKSIYDAARLAFQVKGNTLSASINGQQLITTTDSSFSNGAPGAGQRWYEAYFDNFIVQDLRNATVTSIQSTQKTTSDYFTIKIAEQLDNDRATGMKDNLESAGFIPTEIKPVANGSYELVVGRFLSKEEANRQNQNLLKAGYFSGRIVRLSEAGLNKQQQQAFTGSYQAQKIEHKYRILLGAFPDKADAADMKATVEVAGYYPVDIVFENNQWKVYQGKYDNESLAQEAKNSMYRDGFISVNIIRMEEEVRTISREEEIRNREEETRLRASIEQSRQQGNTLQQVQQLEQLLQYTKKQDDVIQELQKAFEEMNKKQKEELKNQKEEEALKEIKKKVLDDRHQEAFSLLDQGDYQSALALWEKNIDEDDLGTSGKWVMYAEICKEKIKEQQNEEAKKKEEETKDQKIRELLDKGMNELSAGNYDQAKRTFGNVKYFDPDNMEAENALGQIMAAQTRNSGGLLKNNYAFLIGIIVVVIIIACIMGYIIYKYNQIAERDKKLLEQVQQLAYNPPVDQPQGPLAGNSEKTPVIEAPAPAAPKGPVTAPKGPVTAPKGPVTAPQGPVAAPKGPVAAPKPVAEKTSFDPKAQADTMTSELEASMAKQEKVAPKPPIAKPISAPEIKKEETPAPEPIESFSLSIGEEEENTDQDIEEGGLNINLTGGLNIEPPIKEVEPLEKEAVEEKLPPIDSSLQETVIAQPNLKEEPKLQTGVEEKSVEEISQFFTAEPALTPTTEPVSDILFSQDFESEKKGESPEGWEGSYDYASLLVSDAVDVTSGSKCCCYDKSEPKGTAYYYRTIDDMKGKFSIEFDFRCDEKNKYLLGVYLEKNKDFRQSIHTILYMVDPANPSLRLQGESCPYKMGEWKKIRYEIDLNQSIVNGYVNGVHILKESSIPENLDMINTISLRDNLGTTGKMYLDNLVINKL